jgi:epoxyqueuosine reductase
MMLDAASVKRRARELGFHLCGVARAETVPGPGRIHEWIARGYAGDMGYLPRTAVRREDVRRVLPSARSVIVTATLYNTDRPYSIEIGEPGTGLVSRYAWGEDYHAVVGRRLDALIDWMRGEHPTPFDAIACVDTGPVHERAYAELAGLGWIGKNGCLINPDTGSWLFLSEIVCSLPLEADAAAFDRCGPCTLCLEACPTGALVEPRVLDARRCVSYLTVELRRAIPEPLRAQLGTHVFGCDICQDVCPWNQAVPRSADPAWQPGEGLDRPRLVDLWRRTDEGLERLVQGTAMVRARVTGLRRNVAVAIGNSTDTESGLALEEAADGAGSPSRDDPRVEGHIRWASARRASFRPPGADRRRRS